MRPEEIEQLKSQIDDLNALLSEAIKPQTAWSARQERLSILLLKLQDGLLNQRIFHRLEKWLLADRDSLEYYLDFMMLSALLHIHFGPERTDPFQPELAAFSEQTIADETRSV
jgi:hypothetical protein